MANLSGKQRADYVRHMFTRIAGSYDLVNRWMTWGKDVKLRQQVLDIAALPDHGYLLDVGTGTGDLAIAAWSQNESSSIIGVDFTIGMLRKAQQRKGGEGVHWMIADALELPFKNEGFDAVISGYLLRNVIDIERAIKDHYRVLKPGGHMVCLDTTPIPLDLWHLPIRVYVNQLIPLIGKLISGDSKAYHYLPESTSNFLTADELMRCIKKVGFSDVHFRRVMGGSMAIHWGTK